MYSKCVTSASSPNKTNQNQGEGKLKKDKQINIRITNALHEQLTEAASSKGLKQSAYICDALVKQLQDKETANSTDESFWKEHINQLANELQAQRQTHERMVIELQTEKKALYDQIQQQANLLSEYQAGHQQVAEMHSRSLFQRLKAVLVANP